jgi:hypothetical protein
MRSYAKNSSSATSSRPSAGEVVESQDGRFRPAIVVGQLGWQCRSRPSRLRAVQVLDPPALALHAVGATG